MQQTHRRGDTCVARNTAAWNTAAPNPHAHPPSTRNPPQPPQYNRRTVGATLVSPGTPPPGTPPPPIHTHRPQRATRPSRRRTTRLVNCAVPAPGGMNGAPTSYAAKQPTRNNVQPPQCSRRTVGATLVSPGTPPLGTPPPGTPPPPIHTHRPQRATRPSRRRTTRLVNCAVPAPGVMNGAPTSYAAKQPTRNNVQPPQCNRRTVGATLVSPGTPPSGTPPPQIHTHTALNAQPTRTLSPAETRTGVTNVPLRRQEKQLPCPSKRGLLPPELAGHPPENAGQ